MFYLPLFHNLEGQHCLVVGAGTTALRKLRWLVRTGAHIHIVAENVHADVIQLITESGTDIEVLEESFSPQHIHAQLALVISATDNRAINRQVYEIAVQHNVPVNCVDDPQHCTVLFPAIIDRAPILVAVSSMGHSPSLSRVVRGWIEERLPASLGAMAILANEFRDRVKTRFSSTQDRMHFWDGVFSSTVAQESMAGDTDKARASLTTLLEDSPERNVIQGSVTLVGAGPGDPELLTLKAMRSLQTADVILYDKLANPEILDYARRDADLVYVGKQGPKPGELPDRIDNRSNQQEDINALIVRHAKQGQRVVRLKGGDPYIYGRGGEEVAAIVEAGIKVQVIPGITASLGAAAYAGIPLTHRDLSQSVRFVTGHRLENTVDLDWPEFAKAGQTLVIYMGLVGLAEIMQALLDHGCEASRPVALIENATFPHQRVLVGTVADISAIASEADISGPTVVIIGDVVGLRNP